MRFADPAQSLGSQLGLDETLQAQSANLADLQSSNTIAQSTLSASQNALTQMATDAQTCECYHDCAKLRQCQHAAGSGSVAPRLLHIFAEQHGRRSVYLRGHEQYRRNRFQALQGPQAATAAAFQGAFGMAQSDPSVSAISGAQMQAFLTGSFANLFQGSQWAANWSQASSTRTSALISPTDVVTTSVTANESAFQDLANAYASIADLGIGNLSASARQAVLSNALNEASAAQQGITGLQATLGLSQSQITNANTQMQTQAFS